MLSWNLICKPKDEGSLGLKNLKDWNRACMAKLLWEILQGKESLWLAWAQNKYLAKKSIWEIQPKAYDSMVWKGIQQARQWLKSHISYTIGDGASTNMWADPWLAGTSIVQLYGDRIQ